MKIIECPRDAMQGLAHFVPTELKIRYINSLLKVGFDTIDFGSFVSSKAVPQMRDTADVLEGLLLSDTVTRLLAIVANVRGAEDAADFEEIHYLGYPLSLSETFQQRNTNRSVDAAFDNLAEIQEICDQNNKTLVVYLSMGFGNPYGDPYETSYVSDFVSRLDAMEVSIISLADTIGAAQPALITALFGTLIPRFPHIEFGAHLHAHPSEAEAKVMAAYQAGCRRVDGALRGYGGCPMAGDELTGNVPTEVMIHTLQKMNVELNLDAKAFEKSLLASHEVFL